MRPKQRGYGDRVYIEPTEAQGAAFIGAGREGPVIMLNMLRFRAVADYSDFPDLAPDSPISGPEAYARYAAHAKPFLEEAGGEVMFQGFGGPNLVGPEPERWDLIMLVKHQSTDAFLAFATNEGYLAGVGHRIAALEDARLLPLSATGGSAQIG